MEVNKKRASYLIQRRREEPSASLWQPWWLHLKQIGERIPQLRPSASEMRPMISEYSSIVLLSFRIDSFRCANQGSPWFQTLQCYSRRSESLAPLSLSSIPNVNKVKFPFWDFSRCVAHADTIYFKFHRCSNWKCERLKFRSITGNWLHPGRDVQFNMVLLITHVQTETIHHGYCRKTHEKNRQLGVLMRASWLIFPVRFRTRKHYRWEHTLRPAAKEA